MLLFSHSAVSKSLQPHGLQHARLPCPSANPGACSNSWPLSQWCHLALCHPLLWPSLFPSICTSVVPKNLYADIRGYWEVNSSWGRALINGICAFMNNSERSLGTSSNKIQWEACELQEGHSLSHYGILVSDFQPLELWDLNFYCS